MNTHTLLIVDDNWTWCTELLRSFEQYPLFGILKPVCDGHAAIDALESSRPDILLLDLILPIYDGLYILNYIQREMPDYQPFIYVLSALGREKTNKIMHNMNADYYSIKPIAAAAVVENLLNLLYPAAAHGRRLTSPSPDNAVALTPKIIDIEKQVDDYLFELGAPLYRLSTKCLRLALCLALADQSVLDSSMKLYKQVGELLGEKVCNAKAVERNIRSAINIIQDTDSLSYRKYFPEQKRKLKNTDFLHGSVYILKLRSEDYLSDRHVIPVRGSSVG